MESSPKVLFSVGFGECLFWTRVKRLYKHTQQVKEQCNAVMIKTYCCFMTVSCVSPTDPQRLGRWMRREEEGLSQALSLLRQHWPAKRGQDAFRAWSPLLPRALFHSAEAGPGQDPLVVFISPCEIVDEETVQQQAVGVGGEGKMEAVSLSYYWQALVNQKQPGVTSHYTLPSSCLCVHPSFPSHLPVASYTVLSIQPVFFLSSTTSRVSSLRMSLLCTLSARLSQMSVHTLSSATRYLNCHLSPLSRL